MAQSLVPPRRAWTVDDLAELPDGPRYEILDGSLLVTPPPDVRHLEVNALVARVLDRQAPPGMLATAAVGGILVRGGRTYYVPDVLVVPR
jgi:Uma2 family endonuclease